MKEIVKVSWRHCLSLPESERDSEVGWRHCLSLPESERDSEGRLKTLFKFTRKWKR